MFYFYYGSQCVRNIGSEGVGSHSQPYQDTYVTKLTASNQSKPSYSSNDPGLAHDLTIV